MRTNVRLLLTSMLILPLVACQPNGKSDNNNLVERDSVWVNDAVGTNNELVDAFFKDFQEKNDGWTKTDAGHKKLVKAFEEKMTTDIEFEKACACYNTTYEYSNPIKDSESISAYSKDDGEEGEIKAFDFVIDVKLIKPLYNGQKEITVKYEIISTIPSTIEEHWRPYVEKSNFCSTFDPFQKNSYNGTLDLGCFLVTYKDK